MSRTVVALLVAGAAVAVEVSPGWVRSATATCDKGEQAVGGGYGVQATRYTQPLTGKVPMNQFPVLASYPSSRTSWTVTVYNRSDEPVMVVAHVECGSRSVGVQIVDAPVGLDLTGTHVDCPQKTTMVTGGGWQITGTKQYMAVIDIRSSYAFENSWKVVAWRPGGSIAAVPPMGVTGFAVCAGHTVTRGSYEPVMAVAPHGPKDMATDATVEAGCAGGEVLTGAGQHAYEGVLGFTTFFPRYGGGWVLTIYSLPGQGYEDIVNSGGSGIVFPMCAKVT